MKKQAMAKELLKMAKSLVAVPASGTDRQTALDYIESLRSIMGIARVIGSMAEGEMHGAKRSGLARGDFAGFTPERVQKAKNVADALEKVSLQMDNL